VIVSPKNGVLTHDELVSEIAKYDPDAVISLLTDTIDAAVLDAGKHVKIFANYAAGYNNVVLAETKRRGIAVTNTPDVSSEAVAEHTIALMLALTRRLLEGDAYVRAGSYVGWDPLLLLGTELRGKTLGLLGAGRIGGRVAQIAAKGFGMDVLYYDLKQNSLLEQESGATFVSSPDEIMTRSDIVSVHVPLFESTRHLVDAARLGLMKKSACLINTSRGPVVDEVALVEALTLGTIRAAALDVFENEPTLAPGLSMLKNVILTPHIASASEETRRAMGEIAAKNVLAVLAGKPPINTVQ
jgi:lactate dehydrogenase-like 2-hydroxyacid dehydrogenase